MICFICNNHSTTRDCDVCYSYISDSDSGSFYIYNINGNINIYIYNNATGIYLKNNTNNTIKFLFKNEDFPKLSNKERYEYLKSIANNLEFL